MSPRRSRSSALAIIGLGGLFALVRVFWERGRRRGSYYDQARRNFGRPLILGLEVLVAADIIATITVDRTIESVAALGILVLVRIVLSFALDIEIDGRVPWRQAEFREQTATPTSSE